MAMGIKSKKIHNWDISYLNEAELDEMVNELYGKHYYDFHSAKPRPVIFDVGALIGETVLYFKDQFPQAKITAFEPSPRSFKLLRQNIVQNNLKDVRLINAAVSGQAGLMNFYTDKNPSSPWGRGDSLMPSRFNNPQISRVVKVPTVKLSKYITGNIDLLKIDIEGAETEVIREIEPKLHFVKQIIMEFHSSSFNPENKYSTIIHILKNHRYTMKIYVSKWYVPESLIPLVLFIQKIVGLKELWMRIYVKSPSLQP